MALNAARDSRGQCPRALSPIEDRADKTYTRKTYTRTDTRHPDCGKRLRMQGLDPAPLRCLRLSAARSDHATQPRVLRSDGNSRFECSTDLLTLVSESTGVMHRLSADPVKASESWNHSDMCRDCAH